jgi:hypothetical protein
VIAAIAGIIMADDFFLGFAAHAHTRNDLVPDPSLAIQLRKENSVEEGRRLAETALNKIEGDIIGAGHALRNVKLLVLYVSYRGDTAEKDRLISEAILKAIEERFRGKAAPEGLRLIGHTTAGEIVNQDLVLKEPSGIGYNGLSLLALVTSLPLGIGRTQGMRTAGEAAEQGKEMVRGAWIDISQGGSKEHIQKSKALFVLTKGANIGKRGYEYFMTDGIAEFISGTREARIASVLGGCSGDGVVGKGMHQYFARLGGQPEIKILDNEAVCALIPLLDEPSIGLDLAPVRQIGEAQTFHFDPDAEPRYKFLRRIGDRDPREVFARAIFKNEAQMARERGLPLPSEKELFDQISEIDGIPLNITLAKYAFAFPFGNYAPMSILKVSGSTVELLQPIRSHDPSIPGRIVIIDHAKVQKGAWNVLDMLRENRSFVARDTTLIISCISRRLAEMIAGCTVNTEGQIFREKLSSTQVMGFLAYGELSFTNLLQEPYIHTCSCWGMTLRSKSGGKGTVSVQEEVAQPEAPGTGNKGELSFRFGSEAGEKAFSYIIDAFIDDYMRQKLSLETSGWRTLVDIIKHGGVPKSGIYSAHGGMGSAISELEKRGLVDVRIFPGERGRGGRILKVRAAYGKETVKRHIDQVVMRKEK